MTRKTFLAPISFLFLLLAASLSLPSSQTTAQDQSTNDDAMITMDFQDVELPVLVKFISELTGKNFILDEKVKGKKVTIISPTKISKSEAYKVFESILDIKGLTTVPSGKVIKIVPLQEAPSQNLRTIVGTEAAPTSDIMITRLVPLEFIDSEEIVKVLKPLMSRESKLDAYSPTNTLIITDTASNIVRLMRILKQLDVEADQMVMAVIPLEYASAEVLAGQLQEILETISVPGGASPGNAPHTPARMAPRPRSPSSSQASGFAGKIIADDRTNSLIVLTTLAQMKKIHELVRKLDYDTPRAYGNIHVIYLEYANAEDTAKVLSDLVSGAQSAGSEAQKTKSAPGLARTMASFEGEVNITADAATNSVIIVASPRDYQTIKNVIEELDIRRKQVYIEAVIIEVLPNFLEDLGFEFRGGVPLGTSVDPVTGETTANSVMFGGSNFGGGTDKMISTLAGMAAGSLSSGDTTQSSLYPFQMGSDSGLTLGAVFDQITIPMGNGQDIKLPAEMFLIHALQTNTKTNIISTPHLIAMDNEESEIVVGQNVPFITSTSQTTISTVTQVQRENVGVTLRFTPQITEGDYIQLKLYQEISALTESPIGQDVNTVGPTTSTRKATNVVLVRDMQTIVVGGLMEDRVRVVKKKVPWLGDIPLLGWLFRWDTDTVQKNNLLIFLTPTILREDQDVQKLFEQKKRRMIQYKKRHKISDKHLDLSPLETKQPSLDLGSPATEPHQPTASPAPPLSPSSQATGQTEQAHVATSHQAAPPSDHSTTDEKISPEPTPLPEPADPAPSGSAAAGPESPSYSVTIHGAKVVDE